MNQPCMCRGSDNETAPSNSSPVDEPIVAILEFRVTVRAEGSADAIVNTAEVIEEFHNLADELEIRDLEFRVIDFPALHDSGSEEEQWAEERARLRDERD